MCRNVEVFVCNATVIRSYPVHTFTLVIQASLKFGRTFPLLRSFRGLPLPGTRCLYMFVTAIKRYITIFNFQPPLLTMPEITEIQVCCVSHA